MMVDGRQFLGARLGRANVHLPIKLAAVRRQNFGAKVLRQPNGHSGFAHSRGATDDDQCWKGRWVHFGIWISDFGGVGP